MKSIYAKLHKIIMKRFLITFSVFNLFCFSLFASDCMQYKASPLVQITTPEWNKKVVQPDAPMDSLHGTVVASFDEEYDLQVAAQPVSDGYCVMLNKLDATLGYSDFLVNIDRSHTPNSCGYKMTLEHEDEHIAAHLAAFKSESDNMQKSTQAAADSIMPIFVKSLDGVNAALDKMQQEFQSHPDIILMKQKLSAQQEILNKKVDERDDGIRINLCK